MLSNIFAYLIIPAYTIVFARNYSWFETNFSAIGSLVTRREGFLLWGLIVGTFCYKTLKAIIKANGGNKYEKISLYVSAVLLFCGVTTPYLPEIMPLKAKLHVIFSFIAGITTMICTQMVTLRLKKEDYERFRLYPIYNIGIIGISALLFLTVGMVSSALEIFYTISTVIMLQNIKRKLERKQSRLY